MAYQQVVPPDGIGRTFTLLGERCRDLTGIEPADALADASLLHDQILPEDRQVVAAAEAAAFAARGRFDIEVRTRRADGDLRRMRIVASPHGQADGSTVWNGILIDITDRTAAEERRNLLVSELAHRSKNAILVIMALVAQTTRGSTTVKAFEDVLQARLQALADGQDLVTASGGRPVSLSEVLAKTLTPFDVSRFDMDDTLEGVMIAGEVAVGLALLLHELSTNAMKYGALSVPKGRVRLGRRADDSGGTVVSWVERGGPRVQPPTTKGFGSRLLEIALRNLGGKVQPSFDPDGFQAEIQFPAGLVR
jgi:PAS domain S-box-containing protein